LEPKESYFYLKSIVAAKENIMESRSEEVM